MHLVYELDNWPTNQSINFTSKDYLFSAIKLAKNAIKRMFVYNSF